MLEFLSPEFSLLLFVLLLLYWRKKRKTSSVNAFIMPIISSNIFNKASKSKILTLSNLLQNTIFVLIILALTQPIITKQEQKIEYDGINIMICIDVSNSMLNTDFKPNRLEAAKLAAIDFVSKQVNDKIGLVVFAAESITFSPLTINHTSLINNIKNIKAGMLADGTAIGLGLASALARLKKLKNNDFASNIIILLTDGANNCGEISPAEATEIANNLGIRIYTIGIGKSNNSVVDKYYLTNNNNLENTFDADLLKNISNRTNAKFFNASNLNEIQDIYSHISKLEKTKYVATLYNSTFMLQSYIILLTLFLLFVEIYLRITILKML